MECLAVVWALRMLRPYLLCEGSIVDTNNAVLRCVLTIQDPSSRLMRWQLGLAKNNNQVIYEKRSHNVHADAWQKQGLWKYNPSGAWCRDAQWVCALVMTYIELLQDKPHNVRALRSYCVVSERIFNRTGNRQAGIYEKAEASEPPENEQVHNHSTAPPRWAGLVLSAEQAAKQILWIYASAQWDKTLLNNHVRFGRWFEREETRSMEKLPAIPGFKKSNCPHAVVEKASSFNPSQHVEQRPDIGQLLP